MKRAFTLIELLVVIAIVAALAGILLPVLSKARERAKCAYCSGNLRQIGTAIDCYRNDWDGQYPSAWRNDAVIGYNKHPSLPEAMSSYITERTIWQCPSDIGETFPRGPFGMHRRTKPFYIVWPSSYDYYGLGFTQGLVGTPRVPIRIPALAPLCMETRPWHDAYLPTDDWATCSGKDNVLYCDGHVMRRSVPEWLLDVRNSRQ